MRPVQRDDVVSQALQGAIVSSAQLPVVHSHEAGDGPGEAAEGDTVAGELDHQWSYLGGVGGGVSRYRYKEWLIGDSSSDAVSPLS